VGDPRPSRLTALAEALTAAHLDGLLVSSLSNIRYLTGFSGSNALLFASPHDTLVVTDFRYKTQVAEEVGDLARISVETQSLWTGMFQMLAQTAHIEVAGFESAHLLHRDFQRLADGGARWKWRATTDVIEGLRERKDAEEIVLIRESGRIATTALGETIPQVRSISARRIGATSPT
jgi:Xaa-Pro aminopeptidase